MRIESSSLIGTNFRYETVCSNGQNETEELSSVLLEHLYIFSGLENVFRTFSSCSVGERRRRLAAEEQLHSSWFRRGTQGEEGRSVHLLLQPWKWSCDLTDRPNRQRSARPLTPRPLAEQGGHLHVPADPALTITAAPRRNMVLNLLLIFFPLSSSSSFFFHVTENWS